MKIKVKLNFVESLLVGILQDTCLMIGEFFNMYFLSNLSIKKGGVEFHEESNVMNARKSYFLNVIFYVEIDLSLTLS